MGTTHYLAYYELHEIPWKLPDALRWSDPELGIHMGIGRGPYHVPRMASPVVTTRAGGAAFETVNENYTLEGPTYFALALPWLADWPRESFAPQHEWDRVSRAADDMAGIVGLCLNQRLGLKRAAAYLKETRDDGSAGRMEARAQLIAGAKAAVTQRSGRSVARALHKAATGKVSPNVSTALRWYEQSKSAIVGADRLVALWIALEALAGQTRGHAEVVSRTALTLTHKRFGLGADARLIRGALGLDRIRVMRNRVVHEGEREIPLPVSDDPAERDWPQILDDVVGEILRYRLSATLMGTLRAHIKKGLGPQRAAAPEALEADGIEVPNVLL